MFVMYRYGASSAIQSLSRACNKSCGYSPRLHRTLVRNIAIAVAFLTTALIGCGSGIVGSNSDALHVSISPGVVNFGDVAIGKTAQSNVTVVNTGPTPVAISRLNLSGSAFSISNTDKPPINIAPGKTYTLSVTFAPVSSADYSGQITMMNAASASIGGVQLAGHGASGAALSLNT